MTDLFLTGFPGFLGSALLPRMLARRPQARVFLLVQPQHLDLARERVAELADAEPHTAGRVELVSGDITEPGLGMDPVSRSKLGDVTEVWHLAAIYDLAVPEAVARRVNVDGTANVIEFARSRTALRRLQYVSTCYVSGDFAGPFPEDGLDLGQSFLNHYEETKFEAEVLVHRAMRAGLPATIYRPGIVVGDSRTGATKKYDGPYFLATFLRRQPAIALVPEVGPADVVKVGLVPRDYVIDAIDALSVMDVSIGQTYALTDPTPPSAREVVETFGKHLGKRVVWVPLPLTPTRALVGHVPGIERILGLPAESLDYFASPTTYPTTNAVTDLTGTGISCPPFSSYAGRLLDYMLEHPEVDAAAMV
jgi:thioester reductase-like protein